MGNKFEFLTEYEGIEYLSELNLPIPKSYLANDLKEAKVLFEKMDKPIVLKGMSPQLTHKSDAGIVKLEISDEKQLAENFNEIFNIIQLKESAYKGILLQEMVPKGIELIIGIKKDKVFGHQLLVGAGGIFVEIFKDFQIRQMPITEKEIDDMLDGLKVLPILKGFRGNKGINILKLKEIILGLNKLVKEKPEIEELDLNPVIFHDDEANICDVRIAQSSSDNMSVNIPKIQKGTDDLYKMFEAESIAVVGASNDDKKNGGRLIKYIIENGFDGDLYPVNPNNDEVRGYKAYKSVSNIPGEVDLACIIVAAKFVPNIIRECIDKDIKNVIIYSSGFAEAGEGGQKLQKEISDLTEQYDIRVLGPNTIGMVSSPNNIYTAFGMVLEAKEKFDGNIGFVSQSGALGSSLLSRAWEKGVGFSRWISIGNEVDLGIPDFVDYLSEDEPTRVISCFMESLSDVKKFKNSSKKALKNKKPILVYKTGQTEDGKRAVQSHTGSMAGNDNAYEAIFKKMGVLRLHNIQDTIDVGAAFAVQPLPKGKRIGIITASGGACSIIADLCNNQGLEVPRLANEEKIKPHIPSFGASQNPIDVTAEVMKNPEMFREVIKVTLEDENVDAVAIMFTTNADPGASIIGKAVLELFQETNKPIVVGRLGAGTIAPNAMEMYKKAQFPVYDTPEKVVRVLRYLVDYSEIVKNKEVVVDSDVVKSK